MSTCLLSDAFVFEPVGTAGVGSAGVCVSPHETVPRGERIVPAVPAAHTAARHIEIAEDIPASVRELPPPAESGVIRATVLDCVAGHQNPR